MTYSRSCGVPVASCAAETCVCVSVDPGAELGREKAAQRVILCGNTCGHDHESLNGPTGCCPEHGPFMYFCAECHDTYLRVPDVRDQYAQTANETRSDA